jgi:hypothetical protein
VIRWEDPRRTPPSDRVRSGAATRPAGLCHGLGHVVVYGNPAFLSAFGQGAIGLPAREGMLRLPGEAFVLLDAVLRRARPLARWVEIDGERWRLTAIPRLDAETGSAYGVAFHLRAMGDVPVVIDG